MTLPPAAAVLAGAVLAAGPPTDPPRADAAPAAASSPTPRVPDEATTLYDAAYDRWKALPAAPYVTYDAGVTADLKGKRRERRYRVSYRARDGECLVVGVALDARDRPDPSKVTDRCFGPDFSFTFVPQHRNEGGAGAFGDTLPLDVPAPDPASSDVLRTIGRVSIRTRPYAVTLVGDETIGGVATAHLALRPLRDPGKYILRDLWVDRVTHGVVRLGGEAGFGGVARATFTVEYREDARSQIFERLTGFVKAQLLFAKVGADVAITQSQYAYPPHLPDALFDPKALGSHPAGSPAPVDSPFP